MHQRRRTRDQGGEGVKRGKLSSLDGFKKSMSTLLTSSLLSLEIRWKETIVYVSVCVCGREGG